MGGTGSAIIRFQLWPMCSSRHRYAAYTATMQGKKNSE